MSIIPGMILFAGKDSLCTSSGDTSHAPLSPIEEKPEDGHSISTLG
jgi:hypothetical protein